MAGKYRLTESLNWGPSQQFGVITGVTLASTERMPPSPLRSPFSVNITHKLGRYIYKER